MMSISMITCWALPSCQACSSNEGEGREVSDGFLFERNFKETLILEKREPESTEGEVTTAIKCLYVKEMEVSLQQ